MKAEWEPRVCGAVPLPSEDGIPHPQGGRAPLTGLVVGTARQQGHLAQAQGPEAAGSPLPAVGNCCPSAEGKGPSLSWVGKGQQGHLQVGAEGRPCSGQPAAAPVPRQGRDEVNGGRGPVEPLHALSPVGPTCSCSSWACGTHRAQTRDLSPRPTEGLRYRRRSRQARQGWSDGTLSQRSPKPPCS